MGGAREDFYLQVFNFGAGQELGGGNTSELELTVIPPPGGEWEGGLFSNPLNLLKTALV